MLTDICVFLPFYQSSETAMYPASWPNDYMTGKAMNSFSLASKNPITYSTLIQDERIRSQFQYIELGQLEG